MFERGLSCTKRLSGPHVVLLWMQKSNTFIMLWDCRESRGKFVIDNITMICDECLENPKENLSPKRKQPNTITNFVQRTIDVQIPTLSLSKTVPTPTATSKNAPSKHQIQIVMESLIRKVEDQTATITGLQASVETMNDTILQQKEAVGESIKVNNENLSSIKQTLNQTPIFNRSDRKQTYASTLKGAINNETPKSSKKSRTMSNSKPVLSGTSTNVIGKPPSPKTSNRIVRLILSLKPEKAVWISNLHRETNEEDLMSYIKDTICIASTSEINVRKLVKKDREISSYSFVSFRVTCSVDTFNTLLDVSNWPNYCKIREFDLEQKMSSGVTLNRENVISNNEKSPESSSKNGEAEVQT